MGKFNRFAGYIEGNGLLANTMYSFGPHLSAQDILLQLNEQVIDNLIRKELSWNLMLRVHLTCHKSQPYRNSWT